MADRNRTGQQRVEPHHRPRAPRSAGGTHHRQRERVTNRGTVRSSALRPGALTITGNYIQIDDATAGRGNS